MSESDQVHLRRFPVAGGDDHDASGWIVVDARDVLCLTTWMGRLSLRLRNGESRFLRCDLGGQKGLRPCRGGSENRADANSNDSGPSVRIP